MEGFTQKYFSQENILKFANYLYEDEDYIRAIHEYKRYLSIFSSKPPDCDQIYYKIALCYKSLNQEEYALRYFEKILKEFPESKLNSEAVLQMGYTHFCLGNYDTSNKFLSFFDNKFNKFDNIKEKSILLMSGNYLMQFQYSKVYSLLEEYSLSGIKSIDMMKSLAIKGENISYKNPIIAGFLSALVPGLGKVYVKRHWDGFISFITIGLSAWQAYSGFRKDGNRSFRGWLFSSLTAFFYAGNIYGSASSAKIYNETLNNSFRNDVSITIKINF